MSLDTRRCAALLTAGVILPLPVLTGCSSDHRAPRPTAAAARDLAPADRGRLRDGGTLRWALDARPVTLNAFQTDADEGTERIAGAVLPALFTLDARGRPHLNSDYLRSAHIVASEPRQVVVYRLNPKAVWNDGRPIGITDFVAQWKALRGGRSAFGAARNAGYDRIVKIEKGRDKGEVKVTFAKPYADWRALFTPLYPRAVMANPDAFNDRSRTDLPATAGPFSIHATSGHSVTLARDPRWWGEPARLDKLVFTAVPLHRRSAALTAGKIDLAEVGPADAARIMDATEAKNKRDARSPSAPASGAARTASPAASPVASPAASPAAGRGGEGAQGGQHGAPAGAAGKRAEDRVFSKLAVRKALEPAYTQLALNGTDGPLADERVRHAVARAIDRRELAESVLRPLGLPARPLGSHLLMSGQRGYEDHSGALGSSDLRAAQALLADAGWQEAAGHGHPRTVDGKTEEHAEGKPEAKSQGGTEAKTEAGPGAEKAAKTADKTEAKAGPGAGRKPAAGQEPEGRPGARGGVPPRTRKGKSLTLRFVLPSGPGSAPLRTVGERIAAMLERIGVGTEITKVKDADYFSGHIAAGDFDLALYSWPATAFPATDARPVFAKPQPAADGSLTVEQNYTRVGTDQIDQLFDQAAAELDESAARRLVSRADARIWAVAGSIPLFQRPELVAVRKDVANAGAFGFSTPRYQDIGFLK